MSTVDTTEGTILPKRPCKFCGREIYLQYMDISDLNMKWIAFDYPGRDLHYCMIKPLDSGAKILIQQRMEEMNTTTDTTEENNVIMELVRRIEVMIWNLNQIKEKLAELTTK